MSRELSYFVVAAWRASVATALVGAGILAGTLFLVWLLIEPGRAFIDTVPRTLRAVVLILPVFWALIFLLEFGSRRVNRNRSRNSRTRDPR